MRTASTALHGLLFGSVLLAGTELVCAQVVHPSDVIIRTGDTPTLSLDQTASGGNPVKLWDLFGSHVGIAIEEDTGAQPFTILSGAATHSLWIAPNHMIGLGTNNPVANLDLRDDDGQVDVLLRDDVSGDSWRIIMDEDAAPGAGVTISRSGTGVREFRIDPSGNLIIPGSLMAGSIEGITGNVELPATTGSGVGVIEQGGMRLIHTFGTNNFFAGPEAGNFTTTGSSNTASGVQALHNNTAGGGNTASGYQALRDNTTGSNNTASGYNALRNNTTGIRNTATGNSALVSNTGGSRNTASGVSALFANTTGSNNTATGHEALNENTDGNNNTATGECALCSNSTGNYNTATGAKTLLNNRTGSNNTASGFRALNGNMEGNDNTATGVSALFSNTEGSSNTASGVNALLRNKTGNYNTASGRNALRDNTTGFGNTASGNGALSRNTTGFGNTASGNGALKNNMTGIRNMASGVNALESNTTGSNNTASGYQALLSNTTGSNNVAIGRAAGSALTTGHNNIIIGAGIPGVAGESNTTRIGGIRGTKLIGGIAVFIDAAGKLGTTSSSRRYKEVIADMGEASARLRALRPVTFRYRKAYANGEKPRQFGLIAEEVAEVFPELAVYDAEGKPETVKYHLLAPLLLNELQKEQRRVEELEASHAGMEARLAKLEELVGRGGEQ